VPSPQTRKVIEASPFDPAANLAGAFCAPSDRRSLGVVSWPEISKQFQKFALILRRTFPRPVPRGVYDHSPTPRSPRQRIAQNRPEIRRAPPIGIGTRTPPAAEGPPAASHWAVVPPRRALASTPSARQGSFFFNSSGPRGQSRPERIRVHRPVYPLERGIQKIPNLLQTGMQFRWRLLIDIIRKPQRLRHQAPHLAQFRHSAPLQACHYARPAAAKLQHLLGANGCEPLHLQLRTIDKAALHQRHFSEGEAGCSNAGHSSKPCSILPRGCFPPALLSSHDDACLRQASRGASRLLPHATNLEGGRCRWIPH
jgi:hypothetical protein